MADVYQPVRAMKDTAVALIVEGPNGKFWLFNILYISTSFYASQPEVPSRLTCELTAAILDEHEDATGARKSLALKSNKLLHHMRVLRKRKKETDTRLLEQQHLQANVSISYIDIGLENTHPVLRIRDFFQMLAEENRLDLLTGGLDLFESCSRFWERYRGEDPHHPVFAPHRSLMGVHVPMAAYCDEGQSHKKAQFLVFALQPVIGRGTALSKERASDLGVNYLGVSCISRFLYSVCRASLYNKKPKVFDNLVEAFSLECKSAFEDGLSLQYQGKDVTIYPTVLFSKGDWPMLKKMGHLTRTHHGGLATKPGSKKGICHLCMAGSERFPDWSDCFAGSWICDESLEEPDVPWSTESPLTQNIPMSPNLFMKTWFYRPDLFHTLHKGLLAECAGSAFAS